MFPWMGHLTILHRSNTFSQNILVSSAAALFLKYLMKNVGMTSIFLMHKPDKKELNDLPEISTYKAFSRVGTQEF